MRTRSRTIAVIPARGGSKRLPRKNILPFVGRPLLAWSVMAARDAGVDRIVVTSEDPEILAVAAAVRAETVQRPFEFATDHAPVIDAVLHALGVVGASDDDVLLLLQPTAPLRTAADISAALVLARNHPDASVVSVHPVADRTLAWSFMDRDGAFVPVLGWDILRTRSQDLPQLSVLNGALYVAQVGPVRARREVAPPPLVPYHMPEERSVDIDTREDFDRAERLFREFVRA